VRLADYLTRIGLDETANAARETPFARLSRMHVAHRETFLFENLSIQTGGAVSVRLPDLERKFLDERRGGYCFEPPSPTPASHRSHCSDVCAADRRSAGAERTWC